MKHSIDYEMPGMAVPRIRRLPLDRPLLWLKAGWRDLAANPLPSLAYGLLFALGGDIIVLAVLDYPHLVTLAFSGFFLVAPLLAAGLYELSRGHAAGKRLFFIDSLQCFRRDGQSLALFGLVLALVALMWERLSAIIFALLGAHAGLGTHAFMTEIILSGDYPSFIATWFIVGGLLAVAVFALAVVAVPMMLDRDSDPVTAMVTSLHAFAGNPGTLLLWAALLVLLTLAGFATLFFGLVVIMPILGHASWHAYRDLVE